MYKGYIAHQYTDEVVAIKTLKGNHRIPSAVCIATIFLISPGFIDDNAVQELLRECDKMKNFHHLHVMTLKGICLDGGPVPYIILPYMDNGSLTAYIRKERCHLVLTEDADINHGEVQSQVWISL